MAGMFCMLPYIQTHRAVHCTNCTCVSIILALTVSIGLSSFIHVSLWLNSKLTRNFYSFTHLLLTPTHLMWIWKFVFNHIFCGTLQSLFSCAASQIHVVFNSELYTLSNWFLESIELRVWILREVGDLSFWLLINCQKCFKIYFYFVIIGCSV